MTDKKFEVLSGEDGLTFPMLALGAVGVVSVVANIVPQKVAEMTASFQKGDLERSRAIHYELFDVTKALFLETNPIPVKYALFRMNMISEEIRSPLTPFSQKNREILEEAMKPHGL